MRLCRQPIHSRGLRGCQRALSLLELIAVLAVIGIFTAVLLRAIVREIDQRYVRDERAVLKNYSDALVRAILHHSTIPYTNTWAETVAVETGADVNRVLWNSRQRRRLLLFDNAGWFSTVALPYVQNFQGTTTRPALARLILISSVGGVLPFEGGLQTSSDFAALWNSAPDVLPAGVSWSWAGFAPDDVLIERIDLTPRFMRLYLATFKSSALGQFTIGTNTTLYTTTALPIGGSYFLDNTLVRLYRGLATGQQLDTSHILIRDASYMYENNVWKSSSAAGMMPGGLDIAGAINSFLSAASNLHARSNAAQQRLIIYSMIDYMSNYIVWSKPTMSTPAFGDAAMKAYLANVVHPNMVYQVQGLFMKEQSSDYYPWNNIPCQ